MKILWTKGHNRDTQNVKGRPERNRFVPEEDWKGPLWKAVSWFQKVARNCLHAKQFPGKKVAHTEEWKHRSLWCVKERVKPKTRVHGESDGRRGWIYTERGLELDPLGNRALLTVFRWGSHIYGERIKEGKDWRQKGQLEYTREGPDERRACQAWHWG